MKLIYLYIDNFPPFWKKEFNFDSEIRCALNQDRVLNIEKGTDLPQDFFRVSPKESKYSRMTISVVVGENGSGKTSLARFFQAIDLAEKTPKCLILFEAGLGDLWFWHNLEKEVKFTCSQQLRHGWHNGMPQDARNMVGDIRKCFTSVYYSPYYAPGAMSMDASENFVDLSTAGKMGTAIQDFGGQTNARKNTAALQRDDAFKIVETRRILAFLGAYKAKANDAKTAGIDLPVAKQIIICQNQWARQKAIAYSRIKSVRRSRQQDDGVTSELNPWKKCHQLLSFRYGGDFLLNAFVTFCGDYWRNADSDSFAPSDDGRFGHELFKACQIIQKDVRAERLGDAHEHLLAALDSLEQDPFVSVLPNNYPRVLGQVHLSQLFGRLSETLERRGKSINSSGVVLDLVGEQDVEGVLSLVELHARAKVFSDFLVFDIEPHLSAGQQAFLSLFARLYDYFNEYRELVCDDLISRGERPNTSAYKPPLNCGHLVFLDEVETSLHPEWQRRLVWYILWFFENFQQDEKVHVVFFSHSPNLLSDIPRGNVCFLGNEDAENDNGLPFPNTFGANIFDLYKSSFFLKDGPVGEFARRKIKKGLSKVAELFDEAVKKEGMEGKKEQVLSPETKMTLNLVGDELIRRYLDVMKELGVE